MLIKQKYIDEIEQTSNIGYDLLEYDNYCYFNKMKHILNKTTKGRTVKQKALKQLDYTDFYRVVMMHNETIKQQYYYTTYREAKDKYDKLKSSIEHREYIKANKHDEEYIEKAEKQNISNRKK